MIDCREIQKSYGTVSVLKGLSLSIAEGELVAITGQSGAGKSTLLHILGGLDSPDSGSVQIAGKSLSSMNEKQRAAFRNQDLGFVFQFHQLLPEFTALENACIPALIGGASWKEAKLKASHWLDYLGLSERMNHKPQALSGGEQQRVSIARALVNKPSVIFADEPSGNLDSENAQKVHESFQKLRKDFNQTFVVVTHNQEWARVCDREIRLLDGRVVTS
ncbi:MAG: ABC transporter ATP-binding protein [Bacteroidia bacterium]